MSIFGTTSGTKNGRGQSRLAACLSGAFCPFRLGGRRLHLKKQKSLEDPSLAGALQFCRSRNAARQGKTRRAYFPYGQGDRRSMGGFLPGKTVFALGHRWSVHHNTKVTLRQVEISLLSTKKTSGKNTCQMDHPSVITEHISGGSDRVSHGECEIINVTLPMS